MFGASPDLQLRVAGREVDAFPVCGTVARGHGPVGEAEALRILFDEEVDAASLAICSDALRNDLAPLCEPGSLRLLARRRPMALATVVHAVDHVHGRLRQGVDAWDAIVATAAPVMVTGTPRAAALAAIAAHEAGPRGWYGGLVVEVRGDGAARVGTILRAATVRDGVAEVRTGGDLVAGSDPAREELESRIKAVSLWRALGLAVDADLEARVAGGAPPAVATEAQALPAAVALEAEGDPFAAALAESLRGLGLALDETAATVVFAGGDDVAARSLVEGARGLVAVGDAAARVLRAAGHAVVATPPRHGRLVECVPVEGTPSAAMRPFMALRYATLALADGDTRRGDAGIADAWATWLRDADGAAIVLARAAPPAVCFLLRPESLLSDPLALDLLRTGDRLRRRSWSRCARLRRRIALSKTLVAIEPPAPFRSRGERCRRAPAGGILETSGAAASACRTPCQRRASMTEAAQSLRRRQLLAGSAGAIAAASLGGFSGG